MDDSYRFIPGQIVSFQPDRHLAPRRLFATIVGYDKDAKCWICQYYNNNWEFTVYAGILRPLTPDEQEDLVLARLEGRIDIKV